MYLLLIHQDGRPILKYKIIIYSQEIKLTSINDNTKMETLIKTAPIA
jgi:hypothetical protein